MVLHCVHEAVSLRLCFFKTPLDEVMVHEEKTDANLMKDHIKSIAQC